MKTKPVTVIKKALKELGCTDITVKENHYYLSGFFTSKDGQPYYIASTDYRGTGDIYYRKVRDYKDYIGQSNNFVCSIYDKELYDKIKSIEL